MTFFLLLTLFAGATFANIILTHCPITCNHLNLEYTGCLRGQHCTSDNECLVASGDLYPQSFGLDHFRSIAARDTPPRADGRCGKDYDLATCDSAGEWGGCCSVNGWCGNSDDHCMEGHGCQSGCHHGSSNDPRDGPPAETPEDPVQDQPTPPRDPPAEPSGDSPEDQPTPPEDAPSSATSGEPVLGSPTNKEKTPIGAATTDGTCGAANDNIVCGDWPLGGCCSMYGYCGNTAAHCGDGCQSGPCNGAAQVPAPGPSPAPANENPGKIVEAGDSGVPAMHAGLLPNGKVVFLDKVEDFTKLKLPNNQFAYSSEYDPETKKAVPLAYKTNAFCSGGTFLADGRFVSLGGNAPLAEIDPTVGDGFKGIRYLDRTKDDQEGKAWDEPEDAKLTSARWYASAQTLADGTVFVASGSLNGLDPAKPENNNPTYEILNKDGTTQGKDFEMDILVKNQPYYMYPFLHLLNDGNVFIFVSKSSEVYDIKGQKIVKTLQDLPGDYRTYPNTGTSVMMPLTSGNKWAADIIICGGGAYQDTTSPTDPSCGRIKPQDDDPKWEMESMPEGRGMVEGTLLADGTIIFVNGAGRGAQGFELADQPTQTALIYDPAKPAGQRFTLGPRSPIPRLYHSVALLLLDGTLLITGSNPVEMPVQEPTPEHKFITDFRIEIYTPPYLSGERADMRPENIKLSSKSLKADGSTFNVEFEVSDGAKGVKLALYHGGFVTHSVHMGARMLFLDTEGWANGSKQQKITVKMPPNGNIAPPGPYVVYVVVDYDKLGGVPGIGQFVQVA